MMRSWRKLKADSLQPEPKKRDRRAEIRDRRSRNLVRRAKSLRATALSYSTAGTLATTSCRAGAQHFFGCAQDQAAPLQTKT
ncbi:MAG: hypothetical protein DMG40_10590 [Acidobacteria bacterium]|nr:MAG: hypothetical protein DMG40_10590 [Acidobacteriota bacterium]